jgi:hypothetical protein
MNPDGLWWLISILVILPHSTSPVPRDCRIPRRRDPLDQPASNGTRFGSGHLNGVLIWRFAADVALYADHGDDGRMAMIFRRPAAAVRLKVAPS